MTVTSKSAGDPPIFDFANPEEWAAWLDANHASSSGVWLRITKAKTTKVKSVSYVEALEAAICYGWIDAQKKSEGETSWLQRFTPRGKKSIWSRVNRGKALRLVDEGRMRPPGTLEVEKAKQDGRWEAAYDSPRTATVPDDLEAEFRKHPRARAFFLTLDSQNRYAVLFRIQTAKKAETRAKRIRLFVEMLERHEKLHP